MQAIAIVLIAVGCALAGEAVKKATVNMADYSLAPPFIEAKYGFYNWDFGGAWFDQFYTGNTIFKTDRYIRLTSDMPSQVGWIYTTQYV